MSLLGYPNLIPYTKFEQSGSIRFLVMLQTNKQTNKQTASGLPTATLSVGVGNNNSWANRNFLV